MSEEQEFESKEHKIFTQFVQRSMELFQNELEGIEHEEGGFRVQCAASAWVFTGASALVAAGISAKDIHDLVDQTAETANHGIRELLKKALGAEEPTQ